MFKCGVILYHSDLHKIYKERWIRECLDSIRNQTYKDFIVYETCYSKDRQQLWPGSQYSHIPMPNHIAAQNHCLDKAFLDECDIVFNVNADDSYHPQRFELQLRAIKEGFDLISTNFEHIEEINGIDTHVRNMLFHDRAIKFELNNNHNVLCHSVIAYTKKFWDEFKYYNENSLGFEDKELWIKAVNAGCKIKIIDKILCHYRLSANQTGRVWNSQGVKTKEI